MILGLVNLAKGRAPIGIFYISIGAILGLTSLAIQGGRRSR
jgi:hypothetical protein